FVIFDDVEVPRDRLFINCNLKSYNAVMTPSWPPNIQQQTMIRASVKLDFAWGVAMRMAAAINAADPETNRLIGEIWSYAELARSAVIAG
ncbi:4-hydroxyphenylacetate 3-hydroxylase C-terminal domain-containing protein, partial [Pseudomonas aeruginosa]|uniref:4-hydroxyphenylacetate 3-hydroxylase C-terminal domain-containing protein n=1 Tax=Pseudomonas aeruginosa TaxID=287 RepID=UPI002F95A98C